jgi:hypothetical protein
MRAAIRIACVLVALVTAGACTTLEDFQAMSPDERADKVCSSTAAYRQRRSALNTLNNEILTREELLSSGYRVHEYCRIVAVTVPARAADCGGLSGDELTACQQKTVPARTENRRVCEPVAVPIDFQYESAMLRDLQLARAEQLEIHEEQTYVCVARARSLSVDEAYSRYKANAEP